MDTTWDDSYDASQAQPTQKKRIGFFTSGLMVALALIFDGAQFGALFLGVIPILGLVLTFVVSIYISLLATITFGIWFAFHEVSYVSGKKAGLKLLTVIASVVIELVPLLDVCPAITLGVIGILVLTYFEDKGIWMEEIQRIKGSR